MFASVMRVFEILLVIPATSAGVENQIQPEDTLKIYTGPV